MQYHPDRNKDPQAPQRFREIQMAYDILLDPQERSLYDNRLRHGGFDFFSTPQTSTGYQDPPIDPFTGRKNYKYHRGKPKKERDLNLPFDNFESTYLHEFDLEYAVLTRVVILGIMGAVVSGFISALLFEEHSFMNLGHVFVTIPFLLFHLFVMLDCALPSDSYYALLIKVAKDSSSGWQELFTRATNFSVDSYDYHELKGGEWYKDKMYVRHSPIDFSEVQQFLIYKSPIFRMKFQVWGIVNNKLRFISLNIFTKRLTFSASALQIIGLLWILTMGLHDMPLVFIFLFAMQCAYVLKFITSSRLSHRESFATILHWFQ